jgi:uncharacterized membrane protein YgcG
MAANANVDELNNNFQNTLGIGNNNLRAALNNQGLTAFADFVDLEEKDIEKICAVIRKPGGVMINPDAALPNQPPVIPNPGLQCGTILEHRLKMLRYYVFHLTRIQRMPVDPADATLEMIRSVYLIKDQDKPTGEIEKPAPLKKVEHVRTVLENLDAYLLQKRGEKGCPLAYVVRESPGLPADDPGFGLPTHIDEMIARAPHTGIHYQHDNIAVWTVIRHVTHDGPAWNWVSRFQRTRDGRGAYIAFKAHYLGVSQQNRILVGADQHLKTATYDGKLRNFTFENYCGKLNNAFTDMEASGEEVNERRKVRIFLDGLKDPRLDTAKKYICGQPDLLRDFEGAVNYVAQFADTLRSFTTDNRSVSDTNSGGRGGLHANGRGHGRGHGRGNGRGAGRGSGRGGRGSGGRFSGRGSGQRNLTDRYYTPEEWSALSNEERQTVRDKRSERDRRRGVEAVNSRNTRQRTDESDQSDNNVGTQSNGIGAVMSQRQGTNQTR